MIRRGTYDLICNILLIFTVLGTAVCLGLGLRAAFSVRAQFPLYCGLAAAAAVCFVLLPPDILVHELGHVAFGLCAGMKFPVVRVGRFECGKGGIRYRFRVGTAGETAVVPRGGAHMQARLFCTALGGALFNAFYAIAMLVLYAIFPYSPAVFFFSCFMPLSFYDAVTALLPAYCDGGRTDGGVLFGIVKGDAETDVMLRVLTAQGILHKGSYADVPRALLFEAPVVREDLPAFAALLYLRYRFAKAHGEEEEAARALSRLEGIEEYLGAEEREFLQKEKNSAR